MTGEPEPDPHEILETIDWQAAADPVRITVGWDTLLWRFSTADGREHALRLYRASSHPAQLVLAAEAEALAMQAARAAPLPVPAIEARGMFEGIPFFVLSWQRGEMMLDYGQKRPWRIGVLSRNFGRAQARLHAIAAPPGLRKFDGDWLDQHVDHPGLVAALKADASFQTLCHLDYHPLNVLVRGKRISGVLDFANAAVSDRRADLAFTKNALLAVPLPHDWKRPVLQQVRKYVAREWERGYRAEAGEFPLTSAYEALGIWHYTSEVEQAVREGRGWVKEADLSSLHAYRDARLRDAGL